MKQGKKLTREMKKFLYKKGYDTRDYLYTKNTDKFMTIVNKKTNKETVIEKE